MPNLIVSLVRTIVPVVVGWLATIGIDIDADQTAAFVQTALTAGYYALVRLVEQRFPQFGWLLGVPNQPDYRAP